MIMNLIIINISITSGLLRRINITWFLRIEQDFFKHLNNACVNTIELRYKYVNMLL
jgi:hypothetical protein